MNTATQLALFDASQLEVQPKQSLQSILECLDSIPRINEGGCGISALAIYRWCKKNGIEVSDRPFFIISNDDWDVDHNNELIEQGEISDRLEYPHIAIEIDGLLWDSTGNEVEDNDGNFRCWYLRCEPIGEDDLLTLINDSSWNTSFRRNKYLPIIELGLNVDLSDVHPNPINW